MPMKSLGPSGGTGGSPVEVTIPQDATIESLVVVYGSVINAVYLNAGGKKIGLIGTQGADNTVTIDLTNITIRAFSGTYGTRVNQLTILTSDGDLHGPYGQTAGPATFTYELPQCANLIGFYGRVGSLVDAFGIIVADS